MARLYLVAAVLFASACNFIVDPVSPGPGSDDGGIVVNPGGNDGSAPADAAMSSADLALSPAPDLLMQPLPTHVGDECSGACGPGLMCMPWVAAGYCSKPCKKSPDCGPGASCVDIGMGMTYCLVNADADGRCTRNDLSCRDCNAMVCGPSSFCDSC